MAITIDVKKAIYHENDLLADEIRKDLASRGIFMINILGGAGAGKTTTLLNLIPRIPEKSYVIEGDLESDIDTATLKKMGVTAYQINTHGECHLNAPIMKSALPNIDFSKKGILFVENIGNLVCPAEFVIGEEIKLLIVSVPEGSDKPYKYPLPFSLAGAIILTKADLLPYIPFDMDFFMKGIRALNPHAPVFKVSAVTKEGFDEAARWIHTVSTREENRTH